jgi:molecular chaperone DnaK (HSP70)
MVVAILGIDLGNTICSVAGLDERGAVVLSRRVQRDIDKSLAREGSSYMLP